MSLDAGTVFVDVEPKVGDTFFAGLKSKFTGSKMGKIGLAGGAAVGAGLAAGVAAFKIGEGFDQAFDTIRLGTGATGEVLEGLKGDFREVFADIPVSSENAATAVADLNTRLGLTGAPLQELSKQSAELARITGGDLSNQIGLNTRLLGDWSVAQEDQAATLDKLFRASQASGVGIEELSSNVVQFGSPLRQLGFGLDESLALFAKFGKEGVNTETVMSGLRQSIARFAKEGKAPAEGLQETFEAIEGAGSAAEANAIAFEVFGARAGADLAAAIREGRFDLDEMVSAVADGGETILGAAGDTESFGQKWQKFVNGTLVRLEPVATAVFEGIGAALDAIIPAFDAVASFVGPIIEQIAGWFSGLGDDTEAFGGRWTETFALVGEVITEAQELIGAVLEGITAFWEDHGETILGIVESIWKHIQNAIEAALKVIRGIIDVITGLIKGDWDQVWEGIRSILAGVWDGMTSLVRTWLDIMKGWVEIGLGIIEGVWDRIWNGLKSALGTIWDGMVGVVKAALNGVLSVLERGVNFAIAGLNSAIRAVNLVNPFSDIPSVPTVSFPRLAAGGRILESGYAYIAESGPELVSLPKGAEVTPLDRSVGAGMGTATIYVQLDGREIAKAVGAPLTDEMIIRTGRRRTLLQPI